MKENVETSLEAFADLMAELAGPFSERAATLARAGLDEAALDRLSKRWSERFAVDAKSPESVARQFTEAYGRARERYQARRKANAGATTEQPTDARFLNADAQPFRAEAAAVPLAASGEPLPTIQSPAAFSPAPSTVPLVAGPSPWAVRSAPDPRRELPLPSEIGGSTLPPSLSTSDPLPFELKRDSAAHTFQRAAVHAQIVQGPAAPVLRADSSATVAIGSAGQWTPATRSPDATVNLSATPTGIDQTIPLTQTGGSTKESSLTLEQYASLCAELAVYPERKADILPRYGLDGDAGRQLEDAVWMRRLSIGGGKMSKQWQQLVIRYREWLVQQRHV